MKVARPTAKIVVEVPYTRKSWDRQTGTRADRKSMRERKGERAKETNRQTDGLREGEIKSVREPTQTGRQTDGQIERRL